MKPTLHKVFIAILALLVVGAVAPLSAQLEPEAGFITLEENSYYFHLNSFFNRLALRSSPARIWYVFQPADEDPGSKPLFVFFNGGPGGATSSGLLAANTGRNAVFRDETSGEAAIIPNPSSWTRIGNLLHVDARTTGFSYSLMDEPENENLRNGEFDAQNYNCYEDGADFVRVLIRFLAAHPAIRGNRVVLVPESYGGIRTIVMLHLLLYYENYVNGRSVFQNPGLVEEIRAHYDAVFPGSADATVPPGVIAGQFGHQILIQTALAWHYQRLVQVEMLEAPGSILDDLAAETGVPYIRYHDQPGANPDATPGQIRSYILNWIQSLGRDPYHYAKPDGFFDGHRAAAGDFLTQLETLNLLIGTNAAEIGELYASTRARAYKSRAAGAGGFSPPTRLAKSPLRIPKRPAGRTSSPARSTARRSVLPSRIVKRAPASLDLSALIGPPPKPAQVAGALAPAGEDDLAAVFGSLQPWDRYFIDINYDASDAFAWNRATLREYDMTYYASSLIFGQMFLENAAWVETFATDAFYDIVVYTSSLPGALGLYSEILSGSVHDTTGPAGAARPGQIVLSYLPSSVPGSSVTTRTIRFPIYALSGHAVTMTEPAEMLDDVTEWLEATGVPVRKK